MQAADIDKCICVVELGADISTRDHNRTTAITIAEEYGLVSVARLMVAIGLEQLVVISNNPDTYSGNAAENTPSLHQ